jgi:hypothetical protein
MGNFNAGKRMLNSGCILLSEGQKQGKAKASEQ